MTTVTELMAALDAAETAPPDMAVETAVAVFLAATAAAKAYDQVLDAAKRTISDVMAETGKTTYDTKAGKAAVAASSVTVSYDPKALDALAASSDEFARLLNPHRKVSERAGSLRITAAK
jgi:hypothetical protein